jgi:hypothetical protein
MARWSARLPDAGVTGAWSLDHLSDPPAFWHAVTETTLHHLDLGAADVAAQERSIGAVTAAIESYVRDAEDEASAVPVGNAREHVAELRRAASALAQALDAPRSPAVVRAETLIEEMADHDRALSFHVLGESAHAFVAACDRALTRLDALGKERHFAPGEAWVQFIAALADAFEAATGGAATASKGPAADRPSRFVHFAHAIQSLLPARFWRHPAARATVSPGATFSEAAAKAIAARRAQSRRRAGK